MKPGIRTALSALACALFLSGAAPAQAAPEALTVGYQGYLAGPKGEPLQGAVHVTFGLHTSETGGELLWQEMHEKVVVTNGAFSVMLGSIQPLDVSVFDSARWLSLRAGADEVMTPRQRLGAAPFAFIAERAQSLSSTATIPGAQITGAISGATLSGGTLGQLQTQLQSHFVPTLQPQSGANQITVVDASGGITGEWSAMTVGADGLPFIAYQWLEGLRVVKCGDPACAAGKNVVTPIENIGGYGISVATAPGGLPVIAHIHRPTTSNTAEVRFVRCLDSTCAARTIAPIETVTADNHFGHEFNVSVAISASGLPLLAYAEGVRSGKITLQKMRLARCSDAACSGPIDIQYVDLDTAGRGSMAVGSNGMPWFSYSSRVMRCVTQDCSGGLNVFYNLNGFFGSLAMGVDGLPVISLAASAGLTTALHATKCTNTGCAPASLVDTGDAEPGETPNAGFWSSIAIGADGLPVIAHVDWLKQSLRVTKCGNFSCSAGNVANTVASGGVNESEVSIAIGADGLPVVSYHDGNNGHLKVLKCGNAFCAPSFQRR